MEQVQRIRMEQLSDSVIADLEEMYDRIAEEASIEGEAERYGWAMERGDRFRIEAQDRLVAADPFGDMSDEEKFEAEARWEAEIADEKRRDDASRISCVWNAIAEGIIPGSHR